DVSVLLVKPATTTTLVSSPNPSVFGQLVTLTATVTGIAGVPPPTGSVLFKDGAVTLGAMTLNTSATATLTTSTLAVGIHSLTAVYAGDSRFAGSASIVLRQVVNKAATTTTLTSSPNPSVGGQAVTFTATVSIVAPGAGTPS